MIFDHQTDVSIIFTGKDNEKIFTGKDILITSINITDTTERDEVFTLGGKSIMMEKPGLIEVEISMSVSRDNWNNIFSDKKQNKKISSKRVDDCSIEELLFACKKKMEQRKNGKENKT